jgi:hypothetical protein
MTPRDSPNVSYRPDRPREFYSQHIRNRRRRRHSRPSEIAPVGCTSPYLSITLNVIVPGSIPDTHRDYRCAIETHLAHLTATVTVPRTLSLR